VAATVNLSSGHLTTVIRERTGRTVVEWIAERRMAEARRLLVETDESVENVGTRVGYDDPTYFARRFRRAHGTTPAVWRSANR
jgi:AraC-like DNA-binding protein